MKEENNYWNLEDLHMGDIENEIFYRDKLNKGKKTILSVHHHSCNNMKYPKLEIGNEYYIDTSNNLEKPKYEKCKITDIKSGVVFYIIENDIKENHFEEFSLTHYFAEPIEIYVDLSNEFYEVIGSSGKMKVNYKV